MISKNKKGQKRPTNLEQKYTTLLHTQRTNSNVIEICPKLVLSLHFGLPNSLVRHGPQDVRLLLLGGRKACEVVFGFQEWVHAGCLRCCAIRLPLHVLLHAHWPVSFAK